MRAVIRQVRLLYPLLVVLTVISSFVFMSGPAAGDEKPGNISDKDYRIEVIQKIAGLLEAQYVLPEEGKLFAAQFVQVYESGSYDTCATAAGFTKLINADLLRITRDKHNHFREMIASDIGEEVLSTLHHPVRYHRLGVKENRGFARLEMLEGNIGYIEITRFYYYPDVRELVTGAVDFLSSSDAIIIDLRKNGGGSGDYLSSYFLPYPTELSSSYSRKDGLTTEYWTIADTGIEPLTEVPLFLLTSDRTFSASEAFAYDMQSRGRAVVVGDSTRGGAHSVDLFQIDDRFEIYISTARALSPVTGSNWEGIGVIPDVLVPSESALDTALVLAGRAGVEFAAEKEEKMAAAVAEMQLLMARSEDLFMDGREVEAEAALDSMFQIADGQGMVNEFFCFVLAYNYYPPGDERVLYAIQRKRIEFFPESPTAYGAMGYACFLNGRMEEAIPWYEKALELDPENRNTMGMLEKLRGEQQ